MRASPALALLLALAVAGACGGSGPRPAGPSGGAPISLQLPAVDGGIIDVAEHRGQVVILHLFATWASDAVTDADELAEIHRRHPRRVAVIGIALDPDGRALVAPWRAAVGAPYLLALASDEVRGGHSALGSVRQVPVTLVLGPDGRVAHRIDRALRPGELEEVLAGLLDD